MTVHSIIQFVCKIFEALVGYKGKSTIVYGLPKETTFNYLMHMLS
jgi:hypothetical protein